MSSSNKPAAASAPAKNPLVNAYLVAYNAACAVAWSYTLVLCVQHLVNSKQTEWQNKAIGLYAAIELPLKVAQTVAVLEIVHPLIGLTRSSVFTTFLQVFSRIALLWGVCHLAPETHNYWGFALMVLSWCSVEVRQFLMCLCFFDFISLF